jgi:hypothetical protein
MNGKWIMGLVNAAVVATLWTASPASAAQIFSDTFTRSNSNTVGNGWAELNNGASDVAIVGMPANGRLMLRDEDAINNQGVVIDAAATQTISTLGYQNITLSFDWAALTDSDASDLLIAEWRIGSGTWNTTAGAINLASFGLGGDGSFTGSGTLNLGASAANQSDIQFRFRTNVSDDDEGALIDNVVLSGTALTTTQVPEPASLTLFGSGLLGFGAMIRRRRMAKA